MDSVRPALHEPARGCDGHQEPTPCAPLSQSQRQYTTTDCGLISWASARNHLPPIHHPTASNTYPLPSGAIKAATARHAKHRRAEREPPSPQEPDRPVETASSSPQPATSPPDLARIEATNRRSKSSRRAPATRHLPDTVRPRSCLRSSDDPGYTSPPPPIPARADYSRHSRSPELHTSSSPTTPCG